MQNCLNTSQSIEALIKKFLLEDILTNITKEKSRFRKLINNYNDFKNSGNWNWYREQAGLFIDTVESIIQNRGRS